MTDERLKNARPIVSVSGGKDSTAMCLHLFELGYAKDDFDRVFMDTGWEHRNTYGYLDKLEETIGPITRLRAKIKVRPEHREHVAHFEERLGFPSPMVQRMFLYTGFPSRTRKWCTRELKIEPVKKHFESLDYEFINVVGIRHEESPRRAKMTEWEFNDSFDCWVWRPIIRWKEKDVIDIHRRFNLVPNRLYLNGSTRVGCWPCINSRKKEIKNLDPERISLIRDLERVISQLRAERTENNSPATFFQSPLRNRHDVMFIDDVMSWSNTSRGGRQFELFAAEEPTCVRWGMCEFKE